MGLLYLEDEAQAWAEADDAVKHIDSNSAVLTASNTVTLIKYLSVGGGVSDLRHLTIMIIRDSLSHSHPHLYRLETQ